MGTRRAAREAALQALYQLEMTVDDAADRTVSFWAHFEGPDDVRTFAHELVDGVQANREKIDALVASSAEHWRLPRLSKVDLNVLRLATFELLERPEIPAAVTLNEAVEIARRFGGDDSAAFVNGVLDHIAGVLGAKDRPGRVE